MVCQLLLYNKVNQLYIYLYPHISSLLRLPLPPSLSHLSRSSQSIKLISLCYAAASHQPSILHLVVYICQCNSLTSSQLPLPPTPVSSSPFSMSVSLFLPCHQVHQYLFLDSIYVCQHPVFVFLFLTYFTLYDRLQVHSPHYKYKVETFNKRIFCTLILKWQNGKIKT